MPADFIAPETQRHAWITVARQAGIELSWAMLALHFGRLRDASMALYGAGKCIEYCETFPYPFMEPASR